MARRKKKHIKKTVGAPKASARSDAPREAPERRSAIAALPVLGALLVLTLTFTLSYFWNEDFWWYLTSGETILEEGGIPDGDSFLYPEENRGKWITHSWLWTVWIALLHRGFGLFGDVAFGALLGAAVVTLVFTSARLDRFGLLNGLLAFSALLAINHRLSVKAELASWVLLLVYFRLLERGRDFTWKSGALLAGLQWLWSNLHGGYPVGIVAVAAYSIAAFFRRRSGPDEIPAAPPLWFVPLLAAVSLATPGLAVARLRVLGSLLGLSGEAVEGLPETTLLEWQATLSGPWDLYAWMYVAFAVLTAWSFLVTRGPRKTARLLLFGTMAVLGYSVVRFVPGFVMVAGSILAANLAESAPDFRRRFRPASPGARATYAAACGVFCLLLLATAAGARIARKDFEVGQSAGLFQTLSPISTCPGAADYVIENDLPGPVFNDMFTGGYLIHRLYPERRLFIDNRNLSEDLLADYTEILSSPGRFKAAQVKYGFRTAIVANLPVKGVLRETLAADPEWRLVYVDPLATVFVRGSSAPLVTNVRGVGGDGGEVPFLPSASSGLSGILRKLAQPLLRYDPETFLIDYLLALQAIRQPGAVSELVDGVLAVNPRQPESLWFRGMTRLDQGRVREAREDLAAALRYGLEGVDARITYASILYRLGDRAGALAALDEASRIAPGDPRIERMRRSLR